MTIDRRVAIVTGAGSEIGIGFATACSLHAVEIGRAHV